MVWLSWLFDWKNALIVVKPATLIHWHRNLFKLFWKLKSLGGPPCHPRRNSIDHKADCTMNTSRRKRPKSFYFVRFSFFSFDAEDPRLSDRSKDICA